MSFPFGCLLNKNVSLFISSGLLNTSSNFLNFVSNSSNCLIFSFSAFVFLGFGLYKKSVSIPIFAILNNYLLFADNTRRRMQATVQYITMEDELSYEDIQEAGEDFSEQLGRVLEAKIVVNGIRIRLEN